MNPGQLLILIRGALICDICRELSQTEIQAVHSCQDDPKGDLVSWTSSRWTLASASNQNIATAQVIIVGRHWMSRA